MNDKTVREILSAAAKRRGVSVAKLSSEILDKPCGVVIDFPNGSKP